MTKITSSTSDTPPSPWGASMGSKTTPSCDNSSSTDCQIGELACRFGKAVRYKDKRNITYARGWALSLKVWCARDWRTTVCQHRHQVRVLPRNHGKELLCQQRSPLQLDKFKVSMIPDKYFSSFYVKILLTPAGGSSSLS